jgi:hypothetical protein
MEACKNYLPNRALNAVFNYYEAKMKGKENDE